MSRHHGETSSSRFVRVALPWAVVGLVSSAALAIEDLWPSGLLACDFTSVFSCTSVAEHWQSRLLGVPNAYPGIVAFSVAVLLLLVLRRGVDPAPAVWRLWGVSIAGAVVLVTWFNLQALFVIRALCPWCLVTSAAVVALTALTIRFSPAPAFAGRRWSRVRRDSWVLAVAYDLALLAAIIVVFRGRW